MKDCAIVGIGETKLGKWPGITSLELQAEAVLLALADAGISPSEVDGLFNLGPYGRPSTMWASALAEYLRLYPTAMTSVDSGGVNSPMWMIECAMHAIRTRQCKVAVVTFGEAMISGKVVQGSGFTTTGEDVEFEQPLGLVGTVIPYALITARHKALYNIPQEAFGAVALSARRHALLNPNAVMKKPMTMDDYMNSRMISDPMRLLDCSVFVDGAGALVITSADRARDMPKPAVSILSLGQKVSHRNVGEMRSVEELGVKELGQRVLGEAGLTLQDIDVAAVHDAFTISVIIMLEELGFCKRGEGGEYALAGNLDLGSRCPINPHGGLLSQGHVGGMMHVLEGVRQVRGDCGARQVPNVKHSLVAGGGGIMGVHGLMVMGRTFA